MCFPFLCGRILQVHRVEEAVGKAPRKVYGGCIPPGDAQLFARSFDRNATLAAFATAENVLQHTLGVVLPQGDVVLCQAVTGAPTRGRFRVGVRMVEGHRQRGFATSTCAKLIETCEAQGYAIWWDCAKQNIASARLARKLGFCDQQAYRKVWWAKH